MITNTTTTDLKDLPEVHRIGTPERPEPKPPTTGKPKKRGLIWILILAMIAGVMITLLLYRGAQIPLLLNKISLAGVVERKAAGAAAAVWAPCPWSRRM